MHGLKAALNDADGRRLMRIAATRYPPRRDSLTANPTATRVLDSHEDWTPTDLVRGQAVPVSSAAVTRVRSFLRAEDSVAPAGGSRKSRRRVAWVSSSNSNVNFLR
jgi:hypothetical protein